MVDFDHPVSLYSFDNLLVLLLRMERSFFRQVGHYFIHHCFSSVSRSSVKI
jgi:hypothetical protein